jgi:hypothetical protein
MRKVNFLLAFTFLLVSCQKESSKHKLTYQTESKVKSWIESQKESGNISLNTRIESLKENLIVEKMAIEELNKDENFLIIPIRSVFKIGNKNEPVSNFLVLIEDKTGVIRKGQLIQYFNNKSLETLHQNTFSKIFNSKAIEVDGKFRIRSLSGRYLYDIEYKNGSLYSYSVMKPKTKVSNSSNRESPMGSGCIDWYLITTITYSDGTTYTSEQYIGTTCGGCAPDPNNETEGCGTGGGGTIDECCVPPDIQFSSEAISEPVSYNCGFETIDPNTGKPTKTCLKSWKFNKNTLLWYTWKHISREQAVEEKEGSIWKFKTVEHLGVDQEGQLPPCVEYTFNLSSSTSSISSNRTRVEMILSYTTSLRVTCFNWATPSYYSAISTSQWDAE